MSLNEDQYVSRPKTLIVFGAGASFGCTNRPVKPPLTKDIAPRLRNTPGSNKCLTIIEELEKARREDDFFDFEAIMRSVYEKLKNDPVTRDQFNEFRRALRNLFWKSSNFSIDTHYTTLYHTLLAAEERRDSQRGFSVINMNYDTLAQRGFNNRAVFNSFSNFLGSAERPYSIFHPHGSVSWFEIDSKLIDSNGAKIPASRNDGNTAMWFVAGQNPPGTYPFANHKKNIVPSLALPMYGDERSKTVWPDEHRDRCMRELASVDKVIIIGWRGADKHIMEFIDTYTINSKLNKIHVVDYQGAEVTISNLPSSWRGKVIKICNTGFADYVSAKNPLVNEIIM